MLRRVAVRCAGAAWRGAAVPAGRTLRRGRVTVGSQVHARWRRQPSPPVVVARGFSTRYGPLAGPTEEDDEATVAVYEGMTLELLVQRLATTYDKVADLYMEVEDTTERPPNSQVLGAVQAMLLCYELGAEPVLHDAADAGQPEAPDSSPQQEEEPVGAAASEAESEWPVRPPVVTIMGHVDHGKTTLLHTIRNTAFKAEAGGITQSIGAFEATLAGGQKITFIDTPGHRAFSEMRSRGASMTDLVVLVVAADDGVKPQTLECIEHIQSAKVPLVVAINKCDAPGAEPDLAKADLANHGIRLSDNGGDVLAVEISALEGTNVEELLDSIHLVADAADLRAPESGVAEAVVLEAQTEKGRGHVCTAIVRRGSLRAGNVLVAGTAYARIKALVGAGGKRLKLAPPSTPVEIVGWKSLPSVGETAVLVQNEQTARDISAARQRKVDLKEQELLAKEALKQLQLKRRANAARNHKIESGEETAAKRRRQPLKQSIHYIDDFDKPQLKFLVNANVSGSMEALEAALEELSQPELDVNIIHSSVGGPTETDVELASTFEATMIAFNVPVSIAAKKAAKAAGISIESSKVIYELLNAVKAQVLELLPMAVVQRDLGKARVQKLFKFSGAKKKVVAGCVVTEGSVRMAGSIRVLRKNQLIHDGHIATLNFGKDEIEAQTAGNECGLQLKAFSDLQEGDVLECYEVREEQREL